MSIYRSTWAFLGYNTFLYLNPSKPSPFKGLIKSPLSTPAIARYLTLRFHGRRRLHSVWSNLNGISQEMSHTDSAIEQSQPFSSKNSYRSFFKNVFRSFSTWLYHTNTPLITYLCINGIFATFKTLKKSQWNCCWNPEKDIIYTGPNQQTNDIILQKAMGPSA